MVQAVGLFLLLICAFSLGERRIVNHNQPQCCDKDSKGLKTARSLLPDEEDARIVGGCEPCPGEFPWVLGIWRKHGSRPFCGGSLLNSRWVLTAGHCVSGKRCKDIKVVLGDHDTTIEEFSEVHLEVCNIEVHDFYHSVFDDVALLELCKPVHFTPAIQPIKYASKRDSKVTSNNIVTVAGWGSLKERYKGSKVLMKVEVPQVDFHSCKDSYSWLTKGMICAGNMTHGGVDSCQGDSGGPLWATKEKTNEIVQLGIVSNGRGCARRGSPGVYTDVSHYYQWIHDTMLNSNKRSKNCS